MISLGLSFYLRSFGVTVLVPDRENWAHPTKVNPNVICKAPAQPLGTVTSEDPSERNFLAAFNNRVLAVVKTMVSGGSYKTSAEAFTALERAIGWFYLSQSIHRVKVSCWRPCGDRAFELRP